MPKGNNRPNLGEGARYWVDIDRSGAGVPGRAQDKRDLNIIVERQVQERRTKAVARSARSPQRIKSY